MKIYLIEYPLGFALALFLSLAPAKDKVFYSSGAALIYGWLWSRAAYTLTEIDREEQAEAKELQEQAEQAALIAQAEADEAMFKQKAAEYKARIDQEIQEKHQQAAEQLRAVARQLDQRSLELDKREEEIARLPTPEEVEARALQAQIRQLELGARIGAAEAEADEKLERRRIQAQVKLEAYRRQLMVEHGLSDQTQPQSAMHQNPITVTARPANPQVLQQPEYVDDLPFDPTWSDSGSAGDDFAEFKIT